MRTIVHLSDLHFGRVDPRIVQHLAKAVADAQPDLVVVSGDFTQRARVQEFKEAASFLARLPGPRVLVPGNHDVPLYDVMRRWLTPLSRYRRYITADLSPFYADAEIAVVGVNTARALTFKNGRINQAQLAAVTERLSTFARDVIRIVVTHHPFDMPNPTGSGDAPPHGTVGRAQMAMAALLGSRVDIILSGHLHLSHIGQTSQRYRLPGRSALLIQAGTATSTRKRGEVNAFNIVRVARPETSVACMFWDGAQSSFRQVSVKRFLETDTGWSGLDAL